jgi:hypothetical protein
MSLNYATRLALRRSGYSTAPTFRAVGAASKPRPVHLPKRSEMPEREEEWVILHLVNRPKVENAPAPAPIVEAAASPFNWTLRKDATHTCGAWDPSEQEDPFLNPPTEWCPACRYTAEQRHQEATRRAAALAAEPPAAVATPAARTPTTIQVTPLQKAMIQAGGGTGAMILDSVIAGGKYMRSWADYCLMDDPHFLDVRELTEEERKATRPVRRAAAAPMRSVRIKSDKTAVEREAEARAWLATPRNKRLAFHKGALTKDVCVPKDNSIVIANILNDAQTAYGDLRQLLGEHGIVVDMYRPAAPGAPMFVGFLTEGDVNKVLATFPNGIRYDGRLLPIERAIARSKTSKQMAAAGGGGGGRR